jgi:hypothetical protein
VSKSFCQAFGHLFRCDKDLYRQGSPLISYGLVPSRIDHSKQLNGWISKFERNKPERIIYAQHVEREGKLLFEEVCNNDLEGIVAKRKHGIYKSGSIGWLKIKNPKYSQAEGRLAAKSDCAGESESPSRECSWRWVRL